MRVLGQEVGRRRGGGGRRGGLGMGGGAAQERGGEGEAGKTHRQGNSGEGTGGSIHGFRLVSTSLRREAAPQLSTITTMRRFWARPCGVSLGATGSSSP